MSIYFHFQTYWDFAFCHSFMQNYAKKGLEFEGLFWPTKKEDSAQCDFFGPFLDMLSFAFNQCFPWQTTRITVFPARFVLIWAPPLPKKLVFFFPLLDRLRRYIRSSQTNTFIEKTIKQTSDEWNNKNKRSSLTKGFLIEHFSLPPLKLKKQNTDQFLIAMTHMQIQAYKGVLSVW